jgi:hypothetical protein
MEKAEGDDAPAWREHMMMRPAYVRDKPAGVRVQ